MKRFLSLILPLIFLSQAYAHVNLNNPVGAETYKPGDTVIIKWKIAINHTLLNWDLFFSSNGGTSWDTLQTDLNAATLSYQWVVPNTPTTQGRIKIVMDNAGTDYHDISADFTITPATVINLPITGKPILIYPNPLHNQAMLRFDIPKGQLYALWLYDTQGRLIKSIPKIKNEQRILEEAELPEGIYFYRLQSENGRQISGKLLVE